MNWNQAGDILAVICALVALIYVIGMWRMVHAASRLVLVVALGYMVTSRFVVLWMELHPGASWIETHRPIVIVPQYVLLAIAFAMTYYELRGFHFGPREESKEEHQGSSDVLMKFVTAMTIVLLAWVALVFAAAVEYNNRVPVKSPPATSPLATDSALPTPEPSDK